MSDIEKQDAELKHKCKEKMRNVTDPMEKLRLKILSKGSGSIKGIGRFVSSQISLNPTSVFNFVLIFVSTLQSISYNG